MVYPKVLLPLNLIILANTVLGRLQSDHNLRHASGPHCSLPRILCSALLLCRPVSGVISWLLPQLQIAKTERNELYPDIQAFFDQGKTGAPSTFISHSCCGGLMPWPACCMLANSI